MPSQSERPYRVVSKSRGHVHTANTCRTPNTINIRCPGASRDCHCSLGIRTSRMEYCAPCDRGFRNWNSYRQHMMNSSNHNYCDDCERDFDSWLGLEQHFIQSPSHHYCRQCRTHFDDHDELITHCLDEHYYCDRCNRIFPSALGLQEHNRQRHHYCVDCQRVFNSESNLRAVSGFMVYSLGT